MKKNIKILVKQSYLLITWIIYNNKCKGRYFILPKKRKKYTITKSPMAHKTFSQEQLKWEYNNIVLSYSKKVIDYSNGHINVLGLIKLKRKNMKNYSTASNLILVKKLASKHAFIEKEFFVLK